MAGDTRVRLRGNQRAGAVGLTNSGELRPTTEAEDTVAPPAAERRVLRSESRGVYAVHARGRGQDRDDAWAEAARATERQRREQERARAAALLEQAARALGVIERRLGVAPGHFDGLVAALRRVGQDVGGLRPQGAGETPDMAITGVATLCLVAADLAGLVVETQQSLADLAQEVSGLERLLTETTNQAATWSPPAAAEAEDTKPTEAEDG